MQGAHQTIKLKVHCAGKLPKVASLEASCHVSNNTFSTHAEIKKLWATPCMLRGRYRPKLCADAGRVVQNVSWSEYSKSAQVLQKLLKIDPKQNNKPPTWQGGKSHVQGT